MPHTDFFDEDFLGSQNTLIPARATQQETYSYLRSCLMQAIGQELQHFERQSRDVRNAQEQLRRFKEANPRVEFRIFRSEDLDATDSAGSRLFLR